LREAIEDHLRQQPARQVALVQKVCRRTEGCVVREWTSDRPGELPVNPELERYVRDPDLSLFYQIPIVRGRGFTSSGYINNVIVSQASRHDCGDARIPLGHSFRFIQETFSSRRCRPERFISPR
jgi:hypothetical protein